MNVSTSALTRPEAVRYRNQRPTGPLNQVQFGGAMNAVPATTEEAGRPEGYEPPRIEQILTPAELIREVQYAGVESEEVIPVG